MRLIVFHVVFPDTNVDHNECGEYSYPDHNVDHNECGEYPEILRGILLGFRVCTMPLS